MLWPDGTKSRPNVSSAFGPRPNVGAFSFHYGTDFTGFTEIRAILPGIVTFAGWMNNSAGYAIVIDHGDGLSSVYMHNRAHYVARGEHVAEGRHIADMGRTGNATGNCCHLEIRVRGKSLDPVTYITTYLASSAGGAGKDDMNATEAAQLAAVHSMMLQVIDYLGANGGHNTQTPNTIGHKVDSIIDYLGANGGKGTQTPDTIGDKVDSIIDYLGANGGKGTQTPDTIGFKVDALYNRE